MVKTAQLGIDIGTGNIAEAMVSGGKILHVSSLGLPSDFGDTANRASRRRQINSRKNRRLAEKMLWEIIKAIGLPVLKEIDSNGKVGFVDSRLNQEFPSKGDTRIFTSSLLRVAILEYGVEDLEPWQLSKAIASLFKRRGYDDELLWSAHRQSTDKEDDEKGLYEIAFAEFEKEMDELGLPPEKKLPCYYEAIRSNLFDPVTGEIKIRQTDYSVTLQARESKLTDKIESGYYTSRRLRVKEAQLVLSKISTRYPKLDPLAFMFGPARIPYSDYYDLALHGKDSNLAGIFGQKIPKFFNRSPFKCVLMPRRNRLRSDFKIYKKFIYLSKVFNIRVSDEYRHTRPLNHTEFIRFLELANGGPTPIALTKNKICKILSKMDLKPSGEVEAIKPASKKSGKRFCLPAIKALVRYFISGKTPDDAYQFEMNQPCAEGSAITVQENIDSLKGLTKQDFLWLRAFCGKPWESFYIAPTDLISISSSNSENRTQIERIISSVKDPVVKHRARFVYNRLSIMENIVKQELGKDARIDRVNFELIRAKQKGNKKAAEKDIRDENERQNEEAHQAYLRLFRNKQKATKSHRRKWLQKYRLLNQQKWHDIYTGDKYEVRDIDKLEIDHIVPRSILYNNSYLNKVVTTKRFNNDQKGNRIPYDYFMAEDPGAFKAFQKRALNSNLSKKTKKILLAADAVEQLERYTDLTRTSYLARVLTKIVYLYFGWEHPSNGGKKRVTAVPGSFTAKIRRDLRLDRLLFNQEESLNNKSIDTKKKEDSRNHSLDALVLTQVHSFHKDQKNPEYRRSRNFLTSKNIKEAIDKIVPVTITKKKASLEENNLGIKGQQYFRRTRMQEMAYKTEKMKKVFDLKILRKNLLDILVSIGKDTWSTIPDILDALESGANPLEPKKSLARIDLPAYCNIQPDHEYAIWFFNEYFSEDATRTIRLPKKLASLGKDEEIAWKRFCEDKLKAKKMPLKISDTTKDHILMTTNGHGKLIGIDTKGSHSFQYLALSEAGEWKVYVKYVFESMSDFYNKAPSGGLVIHSGDLIRIENDRYDFEKIWLVKSLGVNEQFTLVEPHLKKSKPYKPAINYRGKARKIEKVNLDELPYPPHI